MWKILPFPSVRRQMWLMVVDFVFDIDAVGVDGCLAQFETFFPPQPRPTRA